MKFIPRILHMHRKESLTLYLEKVPEARERRFKDKHIIQKLKSKFIALGFVSDAELVEFVAEYTLYDRYWRKILEERKDLRGKDYDQGVELSQKKQVELGMEPGFDYKGFNKAYQKDEHGIDVK